MLAPEGPCWIPPVGTGACAHQGASGLHFGEGEGQAETQSGTSGGCRRHSIQPIRKEWGLWGFGTCEQRETLAKMVPLPGYAGAWARSCKGIWRHSVKLYWHQEVFNL